MRREADHQDDSSVSSPKWAEFAGGALKKPLAVRYPYSTDKFPKPQRDQMVERFQSSDGEGRCLFGLSVKASGTGLNLTAANHVFHFDRWCNPAVENQTIS